MIDEPATGPINWAPRADPTRTTRQTRETTRPMTRQTTRQTTGEEKKAQWGWGPLRERESPWFFFAVTSSAPRCVRSLQGANPKSGKEGVGVKKLNFHFPSPQRRAL